jgi:predicted DsbA family dithiol-disulfide isomerase
MIQRVVIALLLVLVACERGERSEIAAELDGVVITTAELDEWIKEAMFRSQAGTPAELFELRERGLEALLQERVIEREASRRGVSPERLIELEMEALGPVDDEEVAAFYRENRAALGDDSLEQVRDRIRDYLRAQREEEARWSLRERADVTIHLAPPRFEFTAEGPSRGPADARVTIIGFSEFQCPFCRQAAATLREVLERYPDDVRFVFRNFAIRSHPRSYPAAEAALCAGEQEQFWPYHDMLFANPRALEDEHLLQYAEELGLDTKRFEQCVAAGEYRGRIEAETREARSMGISGTPAFLVNGLLLPGARPAEEFYRVIDAELARLDES